MASTLLQPIAAAIAAVGGALDVTNTVKGYTWDPGPTGIDKVPCVIVGPPEIRRTEIDEPEQQLYTDDWWLDYPVMIGVALDQSTVNTTRLVEIVEAFIKAIDADHTLGGLADDAVVTQVAGPDPTDQGWPGKPLYFYACTIAVRALV